jgi:hypothetical protein
MTAGRSGEREGLSRRRAAHRLFGLALAAGLAMIGRADAEDFTGRAILSDQIFSSGDLENHFFDQLYELRFTRQVTDPFSYLLFLRGERSDGHSTVAGETNALRFTQLEPHAEATYTLPTILLLGRWDMVDSHSQITGAPDDRRRLDHFYGTFAFTPDGFPGFRVLAQRDHASSDTLALDQTRSYLQGEPPGEARPHGGGAPQRVRGRGEWFGPEDRGGAGQPRLRGDTPP